MLCGAVPQKSNRANEIVDVAETYGDAWATPEYDRAGNMTTIPLPASTSPINPYSGTYDAWNRLVSVPAYSQSYRYDALHRRITSGTGTSQRHYYYSASWQVLEERLGTSPDTAPPERQFVWGLRYLDDCVLRDRSPTNNGVLSERLYALQDANWNVTCLVDVAGTPVERYTYRAYGAPWFYSGTFVPRNPGGLYQWETLYAGYRFDLFTGFYQVRYRYLHPGLGCWLTRDPIRYRAGDVNLTRYVRSAPLYIVDPTGAKLRIMVDPHRHAGGMGDAAMMMAELSHYVQTICKHANVGASQGFAIGNAQIADVTMSDDKDMSVGCCCLRQIVDSANEWTVIAFAIDPLLTKDQWPRTEPADWERWAEQGQGYVRADGTPGRGVGGTIYAPLKGPLEATFFDETGQPQVAPEWRVLGHELCGHAFYLDQGMHLTTPPEVFGKPERPHHDQAIAADNRLAKDIDPTQPTRGLFRHPGRGESVMRRRE